MSASNVNSVQFDGDVVLVGGVSYLVREYDNLGHINEAVVAGVPANTANYFAPGARIINSSGGVGTTLYLNEGTYAAPAFSAVETPASTITGVTAQEGLSGGGAAGTVTLDVAQSIKNTSGATLTVGTLVRLTSFSGVAGQTVTLADADTNLPATHVVKTAILDTAVGVVYPIATVTGVNTAARTIGDAVYLSATAGGFTFTAPTGADQLQQQVGTVKVVDAAVGQIVFYPGASQYLKLGQSFLQLLSVDGPQMAQNPAFPKELGHTFSVNDSTTANTAGGAFGRTAAKGTGTAAGGGITDTSGASSNGAAVSPGASGSLVRQVGAAGTATTGTAGAAGSISDLGAAGGASTGAASTAGNGSSLVRTAGAGGASSGGGDTAGNGGNITDTPGAAGAGATNGRAGVIFQRGTVGRKFSVAAKTTSTTLTVAEVLGGMITGNQGGAGAATYTLPTGTLLAAALPTAFTVGDSIDFVVVNISVVDAEDITIAGDTGTTMKGNVTVAANNAVTGISSAQFRAINTGANAFDVYRIS